MIRAVALGLTLVLTVLLAGCGLVDVDEPPAYTLQAQAPPLIVPFPEVDALAPAPARTLALGRARSLAQRTALSITIPACDDDAARGFAVDARTLVAHRDVVSGGGYVRVSTANGSSTAVGAASAFRVGDLGVVRVARPVPRRLQPARSVTAGASVVVVTERNGTIRTVPGVVVDTVQGATYGVRTPVLRLTSAIEKGDTGPVLDANGRVIGAVFGVDARTTLGLAVPVSALRGRAPARTLEALDACD